ncbi:MAG: Pr6Pr family membrane protein [Spirochaetales bacterium]|uniref:Pr6Pr family membrane protein n=1 Tax=Candidatus Thalassospirochaeta sargassi TaxID=3119039 RepID=A0AAJ1IAF8_9SPIO|nr:Pr6Pr family membrane protein [Spirochaetales bacterium]
MLNADYLKANFVNPRVMNILRIIAGVVIIYYIIERALYSWNKEIPALFYFTVQSNLMLAVYWIIYPVIRKRSTVIVPLIVTTNMVVTGVVFILLLEAGFKDQLYILLEHDYISSVIHSVALAASNVTHHLMPVLALLDFLLFADLRFTRIRRLWRIIIYPVVYLFFHITYSVSSGKYIYPFMDPGFVGGPWIVVLVVIALISAIFGIAVGLTALNRVIQQAMYRYYSQLLNK